MIGIQTSYFWPTQPVMCERTFKVRGKPRRMWCQRYVHERLYVAGEDTPGVRKGNILVELSDGTTDVVDGLTRAARQMAYIGEDLEVPLGESDGDAEETLDPRRFAVWSPSREPRPSRQRHVAVTLQGVIRFVLFRTEEHVETLRRKMTGLVTDPWFIECPVRDREGRAGFLRRLAEEERRVIVRPTVHLCQRNAADLEAAAQRYLAGNGIGAAVLVWKVEMACMLNLAGFAGVHLLERVSLEQRRDAAFTPMVRETLELQLAEIRRACLMVDRSNLARHIAPEDRVGIARLRRLREAIEAATEAALHYVRKPRAKAFIEVRELFHCIEPKL